MTKSLGLLPPRRYWSDAELDLLRDQYADTPTADIARQIGVTVECVYAKANKLGLKKSAVYLDSPAACRLRKGENPGMGTRFRTGLTPWNKGMKGITLGGVATQFKKGYRGGKALEVYKPVGTERVSKDGYLERKINEDLPMQKRWRAVHIILWEAVNGPLPAGHCILFKDGNKRNFNLDNFDLVSRVELMRRNSYHKKYPKEVAQLVQLRGAITRQLNRRKKS